uniref:Regulator of microtubule dynamics protein 1 n=2 Tax=Loa loa TaxID=7209 RepID=A0A1I7VVG1_LOALO
MLHVFNGPVEPVSLAEFQKVKGKKTLFSCHNKRQVIYHEDGRRFVSDKIENEQSPSSLWSTALKRSVAWDLKDRSNEDLTLRNLGLIRYVSYLSQQFMPYRNVRITFILIAVNIVLIFGMMIRTLIRSSRLVSLGGSRIQAVRYVRGAMKQRFDAYKRAQRVLLGAMATGTAGLALAPFLGKKSEGNDVSEETTRLERFKQEADTLYSVYLIENAYNVLRRFSSGTDPQMLWRLARVLCEKAKMSKDKDDRRRFMYDALKMAEKALDNEGEESCWEAHKWYAIVLSYVSQHEGTREQVRQSLEIRKHLEKALDLNSTDATTWHVLGVWYFTYADLPSWKAAIVKTLFGSVPSATYEDALRCFQKAEFIKPNFDSSNLWYLAEVKTRLGQKEEAFELYKAAFKMPVITMDDGDTHDKAYEKLRKLGVKDFTEL